VYIYEYIYRLELAGNFVKQNKNTLNYDSSNYNNHFKDSESNDKNSNKNIDHNNDNNSNNDDNKDNNISHNDRNLPIPPFIDKSNEKNNLKNENYYEYIKRCLPECPFWALWKDRENFDKYVYVCVCACIFI
jgi:hypothetical protein